MDLVLVFIIAVVSRAKSQIWQCQTFGNADCVFGEGYGATTICVEYIKDLFYTIDFIGFGDFVIGRVEKAVEALDVID
jgi:hypothetical protein